MNLRQGERVSVQAPCKINPTLVVIERRPDGFHELELTYLALELADRLQLTRTLGSEGELRIDGPMASEDIPRDGRNLVRRAARIAVELARAEGLARDVDDFDLELDKQVPSQAGLGGGSSDAAAAVLGVCASSGLDPDDPRLLRSLAELGSDCSFFLAARASGHARGRGRGERIEVLPALRPGVFVALIAPVLRSPTEAVYRALGELGDAGRQRARAAQIARAWSRATTLEALRAALVNDLEAPAVRALPELGRWRALVDQHAGGHFRLAGSGSSFFGLYSDEREARTVLSGIAQAASASGLGLRGSWVARTADHGARIPV